MSVESAAGTGYSLLKFILGHTAAAAVASALGFLVIRPRTAWEAMVRIFSTLFASFVFGPPMVAFLHSRHPELFESAAKLAAQEGMTGLGELYIAWPIVVMCGLPAWWVIGWIMRWFDNRRDKDFTDVVAEASVIWRIFKPSGAVAATMVAKTTTTSTAEGPVTQVTAEIKTPIEEPKSQVSP